MQDNVFKGGLEDKCMSLGHKGLIVRWTLIVKRSGVLWVFTLLKHLPYIEEEVLSDVRLWYEESQGPSLTSASHHCSNSLLSRVDINYY